MKKLVFALGALPSLALPAIATAAEQKPGTAWELVEGLTTEVGPRLAGTAAEARARDWAVARLTALGFANVRIEPFTMETWVRGEERAAVIDGANVQKLAVTALGNSGATGPKGLVADAVVFASFEAFQAAPDAAIAGKIVYVGHAMKRTQDGSSYGFYGDLRRRGPNIAAKKGAAALIIRSIGTESHRFPHAGNTSWEKGVKPIPAAAISNPDADQIERLAARGKSLRIDLLLTPRFIGVQPSGNVIAEVPGTDPAAGIVLAACHLDSWDLGTGAFDDGAGCAIVADAALRAARKGPLRRTIRLLWAGAEEVGLKGGSAYFAAHKGEAHALAAESDFGADRVWQVDFRLPDGARALKDRITALLAPMGIAPGKGVAGGGPDVGELVAAGVPAIDLQQDGTRYFDLHHTPDDTLDKIDPAQLEQNVQAWAAMLEAVANAPEDLVGGQVKP